VIIAATVSEATSLKVGSGRSDGVEAGWWYVIGVDKKIRQSLNSLRGQLLRALTRVQCGSLIPTRRIGESDGYSDPRQ